MNKEIKTKNHTYQVVTDSDGHTALKRYNEKYKMWITLSFSQVELGVREKLIKDLTEEFEHQLASYC